VYERKILEEFKLLDAMEVQVTTCMESYTFTPDLSLSNI